MVEVRQAEATELSSLVHLTFPAMRPYLLEPLPWARVVVAAFDGDLPLGMGFAVGTGGEFELISLYVQPLFRHQGLGRRILEGVEGFFRETKAPIGVHRFSMPPDDQSAARFLMRCGWSRPRVRQLICMTDLEHAYQTPWLVNARLPAGYAIVPWASLGEADRAAIRRLHETDKTIYTDELDPFAYEHDAVPLTSLALRKGAEVAGWMISHRFDAETNRVTCANFAPGSRRAALMVPMLWELTQVMKHRTSFTKYIWTTPLHMPQMIRFELRRMKPWLTSMAYACTAYRDLNKSSPG